MGYIYAKVERATTTTIKTAKEERLSLSPREIKAQVDHI